VSRPGSVEDVRRALGLTETEEAEARAAVGALVPAFEGWVEAFYARLVVDPVAMAILDDEGRVLRLKRSLVAWLHELFALPLDAAYARARGDIGRTHLQVGMPGYLMVTAMSGLKADMRATVELRLGADAARAARVARALEKRLDVDLCLMLAAYADAARQEAQRRDRDLLLARLMRRVKEATADAADAAACYAELARRAHAAEERARWTARLEVALARLGSGESSGLAAWGALDDRPQRLRLAEVCARATQDLAPGLRARVTVRVEPADLTCDVLPGPLSHAVVELLGNALRHDAHGTIRLSARALAAGGLRIAVEDAGPGWPPGHVETLRAQTRGLGLAYAAHVASLHGGELVLEASPQGGAAAALVLAGVAVA
jgi:signal transduction histidine kinase